MIVTTSYEPFEAQINRAQSIANRLQACYITRDRQTIAQLQALDHEGSVLLVTRNQIQMHHREKKPFFFHPSLALLRIKRLLSGGTDPLVTISQVKSGDIVLDCTAGLCADAIVFSHAVGSRGHVIALESEPILAMISSEGLRHYFTHVPACDEAMRKIEFIYSHHLTYMKSIESQSVDIVYFDPMFRYPKEDSQAIQALRHLANPSPLTEEALNEAKRIARKKIIMKENWNSHEFERLGIPFTRHSQSKIVYGVIELGSRK